MVQVLVVDSHPIVRKGLELYLNSHPNLKVVGCLNSGIEIFEFVRRNNVDMIVSEIDLPELNGITALRAIKKENKDI
ncbi:response regulator [Winogradskyella maritima]|nr:response regulator [Winogradskyella maritima]